MDELTSERGRSACRVAVRGSFVCLVMIVVMAWIPTSASALTWTETRAALPASEWINLEDVSCLSERFCITAGGYLASSRWHPVVQRWNGTEWTAMTAVEPTGAQEAQLFGVACVSERWCVAVGQYRERGGSIKTLAERWDGSAWSVMTTPSEGITAPFLRDVACQSESLCISVGWGREGGGREVAIAQKWNGTSWSQQTLPTAREITATYLNGVACPTATYCMAVGSKVIPSFTRTMALSWNGSTWQLLEPRSPGVFDLFDNVSCRRETWCMVAGQYNKSPDAAYGAVERHQMGIHLRAE